MGNGRQIRVFEDQCVPGVDSLHLRLLQPGRVDGIRWVSDLLVEGEHHPQWNKPLLRMLWEHDVTEKTRSIPLGGDWGRHPVLAK